MSKWYTNYAYFSKAERIDYARRLERLESLKAEKRMKSGKHNPCQKSDKGKRTDELISEKLGIGSRDTYRKEKYIVVRMIQPKIEKH